MQQQEYSSPHGGGLDEELCSSSSWNSEPSSSPPRGPLRVNSSTSLEGLSSLPNEIYLHIFSFALDPFYLMGSVSSLRHVNKCWYELTESEFFWREIVIKLLRQRTIFVEEGKSREDAVQQKEAAEWLFNKIVPWNTKFEELELFGDEEYDEYMHKLSDRFYRTHEFIDNLIQNTLKSRYSVKYRKSDRFLGWKKYNEESDDECEDDEEDYVGPNIFDKSKEWIDNYGEDHNAGNVLLHAYLEIILGHEMVDYLGMKLCGTFIQQFFLKLFEPAIHLVKIWNETGCKPDTIDVDKNPILNRNLFHFIQENGRCSRFFKQKITNHWNLLDEIYFTIPRQYILFMAEHFSKVLVREGDVVMNAVKYVCKSLRDCGIKVEDLCFIADNLIPNFEYTNGLRSLIRAGSGPFFLSHLAVWTDNLELLDWSLTVKNKEGDVKLFDLVVSTLAESINPEQMDLIDKIIPKDLTVKSYILAHASPVRVKTFILNEAVMMNNVEMVRRLCDRYLCNPFGPWEHKYSSPLQYALMQSMHASLSKNNNEQKIVDILEKKYGDSEIYKTELEIAKKLSAQRRVTVETCSLCCSTDKIALSYEKKYGGVYKANSIEVNAGSQHIEMKRDFVLEEEYGSVPPGYRSGEEYDGTESDEDDTEECISVPWIQKYVKNKKRKRYSNDPIIDAIKKEEELMEPITEIISNFEDVKQEIDFADDYYLKIKALNRTWDSNKRIKLDEDAPNEKFTITRDSLCFSKLNFREVVQECLKRQKTDVYLSPHAKMLVQQAAEDFIERHVYRFNNEMTYGEPTDTQTARAEKLMTTQDMGALYLRYQMFRSCDIQDQLSTFCFGKKNIVFAEIAKHLSDLIEEEEEEEDVDYPCDHISVNSEDSMVSCTALEFGENSIGDNFEHLSTIPNFMVYTDLENLKHTKTFVGEDGHERILATELHQNTKHHLVSGYDKELVIHWLDNISITNNGNEHNRYEIQLLDSQLKNK